jgi:hypothetical protein
MTTKTTLPPQNDPIVRTRNLLPYPAFWPYAELAVVRSHKDRVTNTGNLDKLPLNKGYVINTYSGDHYFDTVDDVIEAGWTAVEEE